MELLQIDARQSVIDAKHEHGLGQNKGSLSQLRKWRSDLAAATKNLHALRPRHSAPRYDIPLSVWRRFSRGADDELRAWTLDGIEHGFDIYVKDHPDLERASVRNLPMDLVKKLRFTEWTIKAHKSGCCWGPFKPDQSDVPAHLKPLRTNPQGMVRKGTHFGVNIEDRKWRPINHQSHPRRGMSVNSQVDPKWATVQYIQFREIVGLVDFAGKGARIWAVDAKDAFLRVPIQEACMRFMAFIWLGTLWFFTSLCFGLASAPRIYTRFADLCLWIITHAELPGAAPVQWTFEGRDLAHHYVDDFFGVVPLRSDINATDQFERTIEWFKVLGIPTTEEKTLPPSTRQIILGFLYDTELQMVFIPPAKCTEFLAAIDRILNAGSSSITKLEVLSLIGKLRWASACVFAGAAFVRRMELYANKTQRLDHHVPAGPLKPDLIWWRAQIVRAAVGIPFRYILTPRHSGDIHVLTDASTGDGMGGWTTGQGDWFRTRWSDHSRTDIFAPSTGKAPDIFWKEMCGVVSAALIWGTQWKGKTVTFHCDNMSTVWSLIKRSCDHKRRDIMLMIRVLMNAANEFEFCPYFVHIKGKDNITADALSRFMDKKFWHDTAGTNMKDIETDAAWVLDAIVASTWPKPNSRKRRFCEL
ncbi:MAG: hypothetical protein HRU13_05175 [Phycisphaerales bacterium]|nr:hypothetical protein [Phycisphaerales bacterium]